MWKETYRSIAEVLRYDGAFLESFRPSMNSKEQAGDDAERHECFHEGQMAFSESVSQYYTY